MKLRFTARALADLADIESYLRIRNPSAAERVGVAVRHATEVISAHPYAGQALRRGVRRYPVSRYPYLVFYEVDEMAEEVRIVTIRHASRRPIA